METQGRALVVGVSEPPSQQLLRAAATAAREVVASLGLTTHGGSLAAFDWLALELGEAALDAEELARFSERSVGLPLLVIGPAPALDACRRALGDRAAQYVQPPLGADTLADALRVVVAQASERRAEPISSRQYFDALLGESKPIERVRQLIKQVAPGSATVLIRGESGTGKELVARALHELSPRAKGPFVKVHCAALPEALLESELFGYERGAFTGAAARKPGRVELAHAGTLFLDEIAEIPLSMQVKLLRLLQDREYERLGGTEVLRADVRFVTATHRDLPDMVQRGEFREDLFYRLNVVTLWVPPLRARRDDVPVLAAQFCRRFSQQNGRAVELSPAAMRALRGMRWPGNVRELENFIEKVVVLSSGSVLTEGDVELGLAQDHGDFATQNTQTGHEGLAPHFEGAREGQGPKLQRPSGLPESPPESLPLLGEQLRQAERQALLQALERAAGNRSQAAKLLGVSRATLYKKLSEHGIG